ncbi:photosystem II 5 kDa protein, chloroplastic-like [Momordica charantia]|uniref:Photosystem II 5 kDa protein, chloroplastic-like n=1 Tax=Momordica charantia TaxID=3673 RepID=A0A6J1DEE2_MOMCH|nr:photosystem II 5 kDa protein, chloroplastic-like [Momordica charantia]
MATISMTSAMLGISARRNQHPLSSHRRLVVVNSTEASQGEKTKVNFVEKDCSKGRRDLMFAAAAAAVCAITGVAAAEPKPGSPEARKFYAPVCVTNPTAKICRK